MTRSPLAKKLERADRQTGKALISHDGAGDYPTERREAEAQRDLGKVNKN